jgi:protein-disulfide isomerase
VAAAIVAAGVFVAGIGTDAALSRAYAADDAKAEKAAETNEIIYGDPDAPVTIVEYASLTCPHCANFHTTMLPLLKERLLDTGKAKLVFKDFPLDQLALRASVLIRCNTGTRSRAMLDVLFKTQESWGRSQDPVGALLNIGRAAGMTDEDLEACFNNQEIVDGVIQQRLEAEQTYQVSSTPSFVIDGTLYRGGMTIEQFEQVVESLQP